MKKLDFKLETGDANGGTVYLPDEAHGPVPVVIFCHAWKGNRTMGASTRAVCDEVLKAGAAMVTFDFFGCAEGQDYCQMTYGRWARNLEDVADWVARQDWADASKIGCFAVSSGTTPALRVAESSQRLAFVVSVATCLGPFIGWPNSPGRMLVENWDQLVAGGTADVLGVAFGLDFFKDFIGGAPAYKLKDMACPVFFLSGADDNLFRLTDARMGYEVMRKNGLPAKYLEIEGSGHSLDETPERCGREVAEWLREIDILP